MRARKSSACRAAMMIRNLKTGCHPRRLRLLEREGAAELRRDGGGASDFSPGGARIPSLCLPFGGVTVLAGAGGEAKGLRARVVEDPFFLTMVAVGMVLVGLGSGSIGA